MEKVKFGKLEIGDFYKTGDNCYMVTPTMYIMDNRGNMNKINGIAVVHDKACDKPCKTIFIDNPHYAVEKVELHELNTIMDSSQQSLTFKDLAREERFILKEDFHTYVKIEYSTAVSLPCGKIRCVSQDAEVFLL